MQLALGFLGNQIVAGAHKAEQQPDNQQIGVHHAGDVERDFRKQKITDHILQAHDQAKNHLADKQADGGDKIRLGHRL